ncbi:hypothetical protein ACIFOC_01638 [Leucobacter aridicollis]|uniref:DUF305 domain-containing protein n=1 Tax=Leucobacter aridicollis TaxID=283878 RepID=UPI000EAF178B|nr:uncharacterized protein (DUF305 family) [Mycolicibacterium mucogenicum 261Sha1.1M5]
MKKTLFFGALALAASATLAGCASTGSDTGSRPPAESAAPQSQANAADEMFVTMMIPHHEQAIEMSDIVLAADGVDPAVAEIAAQVKAAQQPEIDKMLSWLEEWGVAYDPEGSASHSAHGGMDGMLSAEDLAALESASGDDVGRLFLEQMIAHHEGAVDMAKDALEEGNDPKVRALAEQVVADQTEEITAMQDLLAR